MVFCRSFDLEERINRFFQTRHVSFFPDILPPGVYLLSILTLGETRVAKKKEEFATEFEFNLTFLLSLRGSSSFSTFFLPFPPAPPPDLAKKLSATRITTHFRVLSLSRKFDRTCVYVSFVEGEREGTRRKQTKERSMCNQLGRVISSIGVVESG